MERIIGIIILMIVLNGCIGTTLSVINWTMMSAALLGEVIKADSLDGEKNQDNSE